MKLKFKIIRFSLKLFLLFLFTISLIFLTIFFYYYNKIEDDSLKEDIQLNQKIIFFDSNKDIFFEFNSKKNNSLNAKTTNRNLINAIISTEDKNFYKHNGISLRGIFGAIFINIYEGRGPFSGHGGSTITQQVSKLICLLNTNNKDEKYCRRQTLVRKLLEAIFSIVLEIKFSKNDILTFYINNVYLGNGNIGFEAASNNYFKKSSKNISLSEAAMLAGLLKAPSKYSPIKNLEISQKRSKLVLNLMLKQNYISLEDYEYSSKNLAKLENKYKNGRHYAEWVKSDVFKSVKKINNKMSIFTFFDLKIQNIVEKSVNEIFKKFVVPSSNAEVAIVVMTKDGKVRSILGGRNNNSGDNFNRSFQAFRQPGSAFKPLVYASALKKGIKPNDYFLDEKKVFTLDNGYKYSPKNYRNNYRGKISMNDSLVYSSNNIAVEIAQMVGIKDVIKISKDFGIQSSIKKNLSSALGASEVNLIELTSVYAGFLNNGIPVKPMGWEKIQTSDSLELFNKNFEKKEILSNSNFLKLNKMLIEVVNKGTAKEAKISNWQIAGKTGTTQKSRDAWFIGYTSKYVIGIWIGNDDNTPLKNVSGGSLPTKIWKKIAIGIHDKRPKNILTSHYDKKDSSLEGEKIKTDKTTKGNFFINLRNFLKNF